MAKMIIVIPVHGTFDTSRKWTYADSPFCRTLVEDGEHRIVIDDTFSWSGKNSHKERIRAAKALAIHVRNKHADDIHVFVFVGHSHGGTVSLYAARYVPPNTPLYLITLATPFIVAKQPSRKILEFMSFVGMSAVAIPIAATIWAIIDWPLSLLSWWTAKVSFVLHIVVVSIMGMALFALGKKSDFFSRTIDFVSDVHDRIFTFFVSRGSNYAASIAARDVGFPLFCLHVTKDEALWWLRIVGWASRASMYPLNPIIVISLFLLSIPAAIYCLLLRHVPALFGGIFSIVFYTGVLFLSSVTIVILVSSLLTKLSRGHTAGFDAHEFLTANWLVEISADRVPPEFPKTELSKDASIIVGTGGLQHSLIHDSEEVADICRKWITMAISAPNNYVNRSGESGGI